MSEKEVLLDENVVEGVCVCLFVCFEREREKERNEKFMI